MNSLIEGLRDATRSVHARLHTHASFGPLMAVPPDAHGYARLLHQLHGFHAPAEAWLFDFAPVLLPELDDLPDRRKVRLLEADMAALDALVPPTQGTDLRIEWAMTPSRSAVLGGLYVIEGATLGGRELGRRLAPTLGAYGLPDTVGRQFFLVYEPRQGAMWRRFCDVLSQVGPTLSQAERHQTCQSAREIFEILEKWLTRCNVDD